MLILYVPVLLDRFDLVSQGEALHSCPLPVPVKIGHIMPNTEAFSFGQCILGKCTCIFCMIWHF
jgi:hypothetical protein